MTLNTIIKVIVIGFNCLNMLVNIMMPALKSGPQIAAKTGNPAGLLFRRIWYSVGKSGVLGITEYRQGRPRVRAHHVSARSSQQWGTWYASVNVIPVGESIYDQKPPNTKKIDTTVFLTDFGRNCRVK